MVLSPEQARCFLAKILNRLEFEVSEPLLGGGEVIKIFHKNDGITDFLIALEKDNKNEGWATLSIKNRNIKEPPLKLFAEEEFTDLENLFQTGEHKQIEEKCSEVTIPLTIMAITYVAWKISLLKLKCPIENISNPKGLLPDGYDMKKDTMPPKVESLLNVGAPVFQPAPEALNKDATEFKPAS